jgi:deferrochelatase/peroxidase EfeB
VRDCEIEGTSTIGLAIARKDERIESLQAKLNVAVNALKQIEQNRWARSGYLSDKATEALAEINKGE